MSKLLKCGLPRVRALTDTGILPHIVLGSKKIRRVSLNEFLAKYDNKDLSDLNNIKEVR